METWIKSKADQLAQAAHQQVNAVHQSASKLAGDVLQKVTVGQEDDYRKDLEFRDGPLGFTLEGSLVVDVQSNSQAERLGVCIGDRLVRVDGYEVPDVESGGFEEQRARALIAKWLKDMPRPGVLTFELPEIYSDEEAEEQAATPQGEQTAASPDASPQDEAAQNAKSTAVQVLQGELQRIQEERRKLSMELQETQEQRGALSAQVEQLQQRSDQQTRRMGDLEEQLRTLRNQHKELEDLHKALSSKDEASQQAAQASLARAETTQRAVEAAEARALAAEEDLSFQRQELKTALSKLAESEAAAAALRMQLEPLEKEMSGFNVAHEAELELLREEQQRQEKRHAQHVKDLEGQLEAQKQQAREELEKQQEELQRLREALVEAQVTAEAAALEARSARMEAAANLDSSGEAVVEQLLQVEESAAQVARVPSGSSSEVLGLQKRIDLLENRCASLQRRLQSQESVMSSGPLTAPSWELKLAAATSPYAAAVVVTLHRLALGTLRGFLEKILRSEAWLWVFYAHLLVLYTIAASSSLQTSADAGRGAVESLNAQLASAGAGGAPSLRGG